MQTEFMDFINNHVFKHMSPRERRVLLARPKDLWGEGENMIYRELGAAENVTAARVQQIHCKALRKIRYQIHLLTERLEKPHIVMVEKYREEVVVDNLPMLYKPASSLGDMTARLANCLNNDNIQTVEDVIKRREVDYLRMPNFGRKSLNELIALLKENGLELGVTPL